MPSRTQIRALLLAVSTTATVALCAPAQARVAFLGLAELGVDRSSAEPVERLLMREVSTLAGGALVSPAEIAALLVDPALKRLRDCRELPCRLDLGGIAEVDYVVDGTLSGVANAYVLTLRGVDVRASEELSSVRESLSGTPDELVAAVRGAAAKLLNVERYRGSIKISYSVPGARVEVDGLEVEILSGDVLPVAVGQHAITVAAPGYRTYTAMVEVLFGEEALVSATLQPIGVAESVSSVLAPSFLARVAVGAGALTLGGAGYLAYKTHTLEGDYVEAFKRYRDDDSGFADRAEAGDRHALLTNIVLGVGTALLSGGVAGLLWGDDAEQVGQEGP